MRNTMLICSHSTIIGGYYGSLFLPASVFYGYTYYVLRGWRRGYVHWRRYEIQAACRWIGFLCRERHGSGAGAAHGYRRATHRKSGSAAICRRPEPAVGFSPAKRYGALSPAAMA